jgi:hypothetical protein
MFGLVDGDDPLVGDKRFYEADRFPVVVFVNDHDDFDSTGGNVVGLNGGAWNFVR